MSSTRMKLLQRFYQMIDLNNHWLTPKNHTSADVFLVSYPRSGNTWSRFLIANTLKVHYQIERNVNFFTIQEIIPDIHTHRNIPLESPFYIYGLPRIIKSHSSYNPFYNRVIFLVRNPKDVIVSYYHYLITHEVIPSHWTLTQFIQHKQYGISPWLKHTKSWISNSKQGQNIQIFTYENMLNSPKENLSKIMNLLGIETNESTLEKAISLTSKEKMKESEKSTISTLRIKNQKIPFVRQGESDTIKKLNVKESQLIEEKAKEIIQVLGYHDL